MTMKNIKENFQNLSDASKEQIKEELQALHFPTIVDEFVDLIVKILFTKNGLSPTGIVKQNYAFTNVASAQVMARHFEGNNEKLKERFGITISDVVCDEISVEFNINY
jgi:hypothetical protein